jgi:2-polyprenyl-3-methyl-5-hydroxy-6-metoxy-1,4-benzoquinol methylase
LKIQGQGGKKGEREGEVLDEGCGTGDMAIDFAKQRLKVHAIDLLPGKVSISRKNAESELGKLYKTGSPTTAKCLEYLSI